MRFITVFFAVTSVALSPALASATPLPFALKSERDGRLVVQEVRVSVVANGGGSPQAFLELRVSGRGEATLLAAGHGRKNPGLSLSRALDRLDHATAPRFVVFAPWDPCVFGIGRYARVPARTLEIPWALGPVAWDTAWPDVQRSRIQTRTATASAPPELEGAAGPVRAYRFTVQRRPAWLGPISFELPSPGVDIDLSPVIPFRRVGANQRLEILAAAPGLGFGPAESAKAPTEIALPEVAFEYPFDTERAISAHVQRQNQNQLVRTHASSGPGWGNLRTPLGLPREGALTLTRYTWEIPSGGGRIELARRPSRDSVERLWFIHRPWRGPLECVQRLRYLEAVAKQQAQVHQLMSVATGRKLDVVVELSRDRGYLMDPFGQPYVAAGQLERLPEVEVDLGAWRRSR